MPFLILYWRWIALALLLAAASIAYNVHVDRLITKAVAKAVTERDSEWRKSEKNAIDKADALARRVEAEHAKALAELQAKYRKESTDAQRKADAALASVHAGYRLRISAGCSSTGDSPEAPTATARGDGPAGGEFLGEADSAFLLGEAKRADAVVRELNLCQAVVLSDRKDSP